MILNDKINDACDGLMYISEADAPVVLFTSGPAVELTRESMIQHADLDRGKRIEEISPESFFSKLTQHREWFGEIEIERAKQFGELRNLLQENLRDLKVFRVGEIQIEIYVVGVDAAGNLIGVTTKAVET